MGSLVRPKEPWHIRYFTGDTIPAAVLEYEEDQVAYEDDDRNVAWATTNRALALLTNAPAATFKIGDDLRNEPNGLNLALKSLAATVAAIRTDVAALAGKDLVDEQQIVTGILAGLSPASIATAVVDALPADLAAQVVDELTSRLAQ